jgi:hypothetical protein
MKFATATKFHRKSGVVEGSAVQRTSRGDVFRQSGEIVREGLLRLCFSPLPALRYFADSRIAGDDQFAGTQGR